MYGPGSHTLTLLQQDVTMSAKLASVAFILVAAGSVVAQAQDTRYIVTRLGTDTVAIERYTRTSSKLEGDVVVRNPRVQTYHYASDLGARGELKNFRLTARRADADPSAPPRIQIVDTFEDSVAVIEVSRAGVRDTALSGRKTYRGRIAPQFPNEPPSFGIYEQLLSSSGLKGDSVSYVLMGPGGGQVPAIILRRRGADSVAFASTFFPGWIEIARVDSRGRILGVNSLATTIKTVAEAAPTIDFNRVVSGWAAAEKAKGPLGQMSPPDTVRATVGGANVVIAYSRPLKRGRVIFGNIVPWNQVWRTGANAATMFTTDKDLVFGTTVVPAGKYTLWTLPTPTGAKLIINSETGQWGTDYHADKDFARVDLTSKTASPPVEQFVIGVVPQGPGGVVRFAWDDKEYSVPFTVK
jgi:Protein of unknown function (DUF2911)